MVHAGLRRVRTYLKFMGLLVNSSRGVWSLTDRGRVVSEGEIAGLHAETLAEMREKQRAKNRARGAKPVGEESDAAIVRRVAEGKQKASRAPSS